VGGKLADAIGRRMLLLLCMPTSAVLLVGAFTRRRPADVDLRAVRRAVRRSVVPRVQRVPQRAVPHRQPGTRQRLDHGAVPVGSSAGLVIAGYLLDRDWSYGG
jgi:predicted MFS family arabinose efflux permease